MTIELRAPEAGADSPDMPRSRFVDRELSWLAFNQRVLELGEDPSTPLLERANFLAIFSSNLDEFFMVRVAGLKRRIATGLAVPTPAGVPPQVALDTIRSKAYELQKRHAAIFNDSVRPELADQGIHIAPWKESLPPGSRMPKSAPAFSCMSAASCCSSSQSVGGCVHPACCARSVR